VVVSAYGDMQNIRMAMNRGAFDFVTKPIDFKDLRLTIDRTLEHLAIWRTALESRDKLVALETDLDLASRMQQSILPTSFPETAGYRVFASMEPARDVGGDFYDVLPMPKNRLCLAVADVSGKGVPAALFMMSSRTLLRGAAIGHSEPGKMVREVNRLLCEDNDAAMFVTVFLAVFDPASGELAYANGGHNPPLVFRADGTATLLPTTEGVALGVVPEIDYAENSVILSPGEAVVFYTDGVTEAENDRGEQFGLDRLCRLFADGLPDDARGITTAVLEAVRSFAEGAPQFDDITCLTLWRGRSGVSAELSLRMEATIDELPRINAAIGAFARRESWTPQLEYQVKLVIEELAINVVKHGGAVGVAAEIDLVSDTDRVRIEFSDWGRPFDLLSEAPPPDTSSSVEDRPVGGLGIHLVRSMVDEASYQREGDRNRLTLVKRRDE
jgi:sigma-B regulation protein RsbU (phosphoserine phosphatase)